MLFHNKIFQLKTIQNYFQIPFELVKVTGKINLLHFIEFFLFCFQKEPNFLLIKFSSVRCSSQAFLSLIHSNLGKPEMAGSDGKCVRWFPQPLTFFQVNQIQFLQATSFRAPWHGCIPAS